MVLKQAGACSCGCGRALGDRYIAEHEIPVALGNASKPDGLRAWDCAAEKTKADLARIAKAKRQAGEHGQQKRRREGKTRPIRSPGFRGWRDFKGNIVRRPS